MNEVNVLWISPWRNLQKSLAQGLSNERRDFGSCRGADQLDGGSLHGGSWLIRAHARRAPLAAITQ